MRIERVCRTCRESYLTAVDDGGAILSENCIPCIERVYRYLDSARQRANYLSLLVRHNYEESFKARLGI